MRIRSLEKEEAIRRVALQLIAEEGLENLTMQRLAKVAGISPRTIYLKYENKEDLLIKLFLDEVLGPYEAHTLANFRADMAFAEGVKLIWSNVFGFLSTSRPAFVLLQYGKSSPLLNKAFKDRDIQQGQYFGAIHRFLERHIEQRMIKDMPLDIYRALLFSPLIDLVAEYFDHLERPEQIVTSAVVENCADLLIKAMLL